MLDPCALPFAAAVHPDARPAPRHFQRANLTLMDGHQKPFRLEQFYTNQTPLDKWFCPDSNNAAACIALLSN